MQSERVKNVEPHLKEDISAVDAKLQEQTKALENGKAQQLNQAQQEYTKVRRLQGGVDLI